ncbi:MAG: trigger factor [Candidatus Hepatoplasma scabrum]|nr:MAG: trigger factor [Candidatus Hepatoplasma sp.]
MKKIDINIENNNINIKLILKEEDWTNILKKVNNDLINKLELKGFRKGKIPIEIAKKHISQEQIWNKGVDEIINSNYDKIIEEFKKHNVISGPKLEVRKITNDEVEINFSGVLFPNIKLGNFDDLKIKYQNEKVTSDDIKKELKKMDNFLIDKKEILDKNYQIKKDDIVIIDFNGKVDGKEFEGGSAKDHELKIGSNSFIGDFENQLINLKVGDSKNINVKFPETYPVKNLSNKNAVFGVKINKVFQEEKLSDKKLTEKLEKIGIKSIEEFHKKIEKMLSERNIQEANDNFFSKFLDEVKKLEKTNIEIPIELIEQELEKEFENFKDRLKQQGMQVKDYFAMLGTDEDNFKKTNLKSNVKNKIENSLIYSKLLKDFKIEISKDDLEKEYNKISKDQNIKVEDVKKEIPEETIRNSLVYQKLINTLINKLK